MGGTEAVHVAGAYEHPTRYAPEKSQLQLHAEVASGALEDAGLSKCDVDGLFTAGIDKHAYTLIPLDMADYLGLDVSYHDVSENGGSSYITHVGHAASAIRDGKCDIALVTLAGRSKSKARATGTELPELQTHQDNFERIYGVNIAANYALAARRHMHEFGSTQEQLAEIRVAASHHAQFNEDALYQDPVTIEDVVESEVIAEPLHLLDCCVITDGGGALVIVSDNIRKKLDRECVEVLGHGEAIGHHDAGRIDLTRTAAGDSARRAYGEAAISPEDVDYASIYDSFTITVLQTIEDLGFCEKGEGGSFVEGGTLQAPDGALPFNTDGGGLCSNHPSSNGGMTKMIEAVRQLRGEANDPVQLEEPTVALAHGTGGQIATRHASVTLVLGRIDR
jgi:acetyl-CoA C-acetyltransferase